MPGTKVGGIKAAATNKQKYGTNHYAIIGAKGGAAGGTGGFHVNKELAREVGAKGGRNGKRGFTRYVMEDGSVYYLAKNAKRS